MSAFFVTATGTDVGKTYIAAGLVRHLRGQGKNAAALKPVVSGFDRATARASDPGVLLDAMGKAVTPEAVTRISPWRFVAPLSPDMAAAREAKEIGFDALIAFCRAEIAAHRGTLLIEGVGGAMVPLDARNTVLDWMMALRLPAILVAGSYLGAISHTLTTASAMARAGVTVAALAINDSGDGAVPLADTAATIGRFLPNIPIATIRRNPADANFARLAGLIFQ